MPGADLCHRAGYGVPHLVEAGFLGRRWGDLQCAVVGWVYVPLLLLGPETLQDPELEVGDGGDGQHTVLFGCYPCKSVCSFVT